MSGPLDTVFSIVGGVSALFLPGYMISLIFFRRGQIDLLERIAVSVAMSVVVVPLVAFFMNLFGVPISRIGVLAQVFGVTILAALLAWRRNDFSAYRKKPRVQQESSQVPHVPKSDDAASPIKRRKRKVNF